MRNCLRILFLFIFLHWIFWFTTYAKSTNYYESIREENIRQEEKKFKEHSDKTDTYNSKGLLSGERQEKDIAGIEEDILSQIEKKKGLSKDKKLRVWKNEEFPNLEKLQAEKKTLEEEIEQLKK